MKNHYLLYVVLGLLWVRLSQAQAPTVTALSPVRNALTAPANTNIAITFDQPMSNGAATLGAMRVFSAQRGGQLRNGAGGSTTASGNTLTFNPGTNFRPGETVLTTITPAARSSGGENLARGHVHQFTVRVGGSGRGNFTAPGSIPNPGVGDAPRSVALGDVDGDGDLDLLTANSFSDNVSVRLNNGMGNFVPPVTNPNPVVGDTPTSVALGDLDGDGDLDFVTASYSDNTVNVRFNNGTGNFTAPANNPNPVVGTQPWSVALGDLDGDGDLDLLTANAGSNNVSVRLNNGLGNFTSPSTNPNPAVGDSPLGLVLGDLDGDGDLDFVTASYSDNTVSVRLNDGTGTFSSPATNPNPTVGVLPRSVDLGDVDGDGDLDLLTANTGSANVSVRFNNGTGNFTVPTTNPSPVVDDSPSSVALGDLDGDGDLDFITANINSNNVSVRLNENPSPTPAISDFTVSPNLACLGSPLTFTATVGNVTGSYAYTLTNGAGSAMVGTSSSPAFSQSLTASGSGPQTFTLLVTDNGQSSSATASVTVNDLPVAGLTNNGPLSCLQPSVTLTASGGSSYTFTSPGGQVLAGTGNTRTVSAPGTYSVTVGNEAGCVSSTSTTVSSETAASSVTINPSSATLTCASPSVSLTAVGSGSVRWNTGSTEPIITVSTGDTYSVTLTNGSGCTATASTVISQGPDQTIAFAQQPRSATSVTVGTNVSASVLVNGPATAYQWYKDNLSNPVAGQTGPSLSLPNVQLSDAGSYSVVVTGACNSLTSTAFSLSVVSPVSAPFAITGVTTVNCTPIQPNRFSVSFSPRYSGLTGQSLSFGIVNELLPTTEPGPYTLQLYSDNPTITLTASQQGTPGEARFSYNWLAACRASESGNTPPRVVSGVPPQSATLGVGFSYVIPQGSFTDEQTPGSLLLSAAGLPPGLSLSGYTLSGVPSTTVGSPFSVTLTATDPGNLSVSTSFGFTVVPAPVSPPDPTQPFAITGVSMLTCTPVADRININFSPRYGGLNVQAIAFRVENELASTNEPGPYSLTLYRDNPVITLRATQTGSVGEASFVYNWLAACAGQGQDNTAPVVVNPLGSQTAVVGASFVVSLANVFVDQETPGSLSLTVSGLPSGLALVGQSIQGVASVSGVSTVVLTASDPGGLSASTSFSLMVSPAVSETVSPPVTPPSGFTITGVQTVGCEVVSGGERRLTFSPQYGGTTGQPIRFGVDNELAPTTDSGPYVLSLYTDNPVITLRAEQAGVEATYRYDWLSICSPAGRLGAGEPRSGETLLVVVLGNPVSGETAEIEISGASGDRLLVRLVDERGHAVSESAILSASVVERMSVGLGGSAGVYLLQVSTPTQHRRLKVVKR